MSTNDEMAAFVITAPALVGVDPTQPIDTSDHFDTAHLTPLAGEILRRCATCRTAGGRVTFTPFHDLARSLDVTVDELRNAMWEVADAGHGDATWNTLHLERWRIADVRCRCSEAAGEHQRSIQSASPT